MSDIPAPVVRATDVPDLRLEFIEKWNPSGDFWISTVERISEMGYSLNRGVANAFTMRESIEAAELFWVAPTFMPLLLKAADSLPRDVKFSELAPFPTDGFLVFNPFDGWGADLGEFGKPEAAAISWHVMEMEPSPGQGFVPICLADAYCRYKSMWVNVRSSSWGGDDTIKVPSKDAADRDVSVPERIERDRAILAAFAQLITETAVANVRPEKSPRPVERRSKRKNVPSTVKVVRLRQIADAERAGTLSKSDIEYSHRFLVSGHWRKQPCGPGRQEIKRIWINPYLKGPEDKPLILKDTVNVLSR